jgi:hypothetical protein
LRSTLVATALAFAFASGVEAAEVELSIIAGGQLLEQQGQGVTHGAVLDEVTLGRTVLGGLSLGLRLGERHHLAAELVVGPYHNDSERYCVFFHDVTCPPTHLAQATDYAMLYGLNYSFVFRPGRPTPFLGLGFGAKTYHYDAVSDQPPPEKTTALALHGVLGFEFGGKSPFRLEARGVVIPKNPYLLPGEDFSQGTTQFELQVRASVRFALSH